MVYVLAIVAGLAGAAGGALAFWLAGAVLLSAFGLPESGGLAVLAALTPLGGAGGLVADIVMILRRRGGFRTPRDLIIHSAAVLTLIAGEFRGVEKGQDHTDEADGDADQLLEILDHLVPGHADHLSRRKVMPRLLTEEGVFRRCLVESCNLLP